MANAFSGKKSRFSQGSRRPRDGVQRPCQVTVRFSKAEFAAVREAAQVSGRSVAAYIGDLAVSATRRRSGASDPGVVEVLRMLLCELMRAAVQVRRIGVNLNQAVRRLNAVGERSGDLLPYAREADRRSAFLEETAEEIRREMRKALRRL